MLVSYFLKSVIHSQLTPVNGKFSNTNCRSLVNIILYRIGPKIWIGCQIIAWYVEIIRQMVLNQV